MPNIKYGSKIHEGIENISVPLADGSGDAVFRYGEEEFVGFKFSDFTGYYGTPKIVDASSVPTISGKNINQFTASWFGNNGKSANGGFFVSMETVYLPKMYHFGNSMFDYCVNLKNIYGDCVDVGYINPYTFRNCESLKSIPYMPNLTFISVSAFNNCTGLEIFYMYNKPEYGIHQTAFEKCTNLLNIYVPWSEGEVANAPWGATNATIHYNTTYDENHNPIV